MLRNNDGAALKSFGVGSQYNIFRNNFVTTSDGNTAGTPSGSFSTPAIYFDFSTNHCTIQENTVYGRNNKGIFLNSGTNNNTVVKNVIYGGNYLLDYNGSPIIPTPMTGMTVKGNVCFAKSSATYILRMVDNTNTYKHGIIDSNYYFQPYNTANYVFIPPSTSVNFSNWQSSTGYDAHTKKSFLNWTSPTSDDTLIMNQTDNTLMINLGSTEYLDLDSNTICSSITLKPYTSQILIRTVKPCITGINESSRKKRLVVSPNPFSSSAFIETDYTFNNATLTIYNSFGQLVKEVTNLNNQNAYIYRDNLPSGIYFIHLKEQNNSVMTSKVMID